MLGVTRRHQRPHLAHQSGPLRQMRRDHDDSYRSRGAYLYYACSMKTRQGPTACEGKAAPTGLRWSFKRLAERAGLSWVPTPHYIKHSVVSWLAMERVPIDQAADLVATAPATLRRVYRKFDPAYLRDVADALEL